MMLARPSLPQLSVAKSRFNQALVLPDGTNVTSGTIFLQFK